MYELPVCYMSNRENNITAKHQFYQSTTFTLFTVEQIANKLSANIPIHGSYLSTCLSFLLYIQTRVTKTKQIVSSTALEFKMIKACFGFNPTLILNKSNNI